MLTNQIIKICTLSCSFLRLSFIWPAKGEEFQPSKSFYINQLLFMVTSGVPVVSMILVHLIKSLQVGHIDISEDLAVLASFFGLTIMMALYVFKQQKVAKLLRDLSDFDNFGKPPRFDEVNKNLQYVVIFVFLYAIFGTVVYNSVKVINIPNCRRFRKIQETCGVVVPVWAPFESDSMGVTISVIIYVFMVIITIDRGTLLVSVQILEISYNIKLRIDHLNLMLLNCFNASLEASKNRLYECIRYHTTLIDYCKRFNDCYTNVMFVYLATAGIICGCLENQIVKQHDIGAILHIFGWITALFVSCFSGQVLMDSTTSIAQAAYNSKWYNADVNLRKSLILIIMRSQKPLYLSTGPFNVLSFALFVSIMKMSYSILTILS